MANNQGQTFVFNTAKEWLADGMFDLDDFVWKIALITSLPVVTQATPNLSDYSEVASGNGYTSGGETLTATWVESGGTVTFTFTGTPAASWTQNALGPTDIVAGLIYSPSSSPINQALGFVDFRSGSPATAISLQAGDISYTPHASGFFTLA